MSYITAAGSQPWLSPEVERAFDLFKPGSDENPAGADWMDQVRGEYAKPSDVFSLGLVFLFMVTGKLPPFAPSEKKDPSFDKPGGVLDAYLKAKIGDDSLREMLQSMLAYNPPDRPKTLALIGHGYFRRNFQVRDSRKQYYIPFLAYNNCSH